MPGDVEKPAPVEPGREKERPFSKVCALCRTEWTSRAAFLSDPEIRVIGYQVHFELLTDGLFLFNHTRKGCDSTMAIPAATFRDLYQGPVFESRRTGTAECPGLCLHSRNLQPCPAQCECAFVRNILGEVQAWPKRPGLPPDGRSREAA